MRYARRRVRAAMNCRALTFRTALEAAGVRESARYPRMHALTFRSAQGSGRTGERTHARVTTELGMAHPD